MGYMDDAAVAVFARAIAPYALNYMLVRCLWRTRIVGRFTVPPDRGAVVVCNHRCPLDPAFIALSVPRVVHWMVAREYCEYPAFRRLLQICGAIPVRRGSVDLAATKAAVRILREGGLVGILPEARINTTAELLLPGQLGAAWIAIGPACPSCRVISTAPRTTARRSAAC